MWEAIVKNGHGIKKKKKGSAGNKRLEKPFESSFLWKGETNGVSLSREILAYEQHRNHP